MGNIDYGRCVFPLTSLQIGDLQSYLSHLYLFLAPESKRCYILVDNRPWLRDLVSRPAHLWQLMVTKSRLSPFANTRGRKQRKGGGNMLDMKSIPELSTSESENVRRWFPFIDAATLSRKRELLPVKKLRNSLILNSKLHRTLYGFIVFEVEWNDVRGINYLNELQTDTSLAIETKFMKRWEFDSVTQAARCMSSWFPGTGTEHRLLKVFLESTIGDVFYDAHDNFQWTTDVADSDASTCNSSDEDESPCGSVRSFSTYPAAENSESSLQTPSPPDGPYKRRKLLKSLSKRLNVDLLSEEPFSETIESQLHGETSDKSTSEVVEATQYKDVLLLFRFNDRDLPFKLRDIILLDLRLLTLLEAGLPSWVIFLQSYPVFCHIYRPWMCPLARFLYVVISIVTVLIGFYDLYKNVPVLKATASSLFGPLFDWIETWEMVSRIQYLGTMLFLHNFQKAFKWFLMTTRTIRSFFSILAQPMAGPLVVFVEFFLPLWNVCTQIMEDFFSVIWFTVGSSYSLVGKIIEILLLPLWYIISFVWIIVTSLFYPIFWILWEIIYAPIRLVFGFSSLLGFLCTSIYEVIQDSWLFVSSIVRVTSQVESTVTSGGVSIWRSLWNDLFSQVFRALRSILYGFVAFFAACNRHRLSIYNHSSEFIRRLSAKRSRLESSRSAQTSGAQITWIDTEEAQHQRKFRKIE
ncbi:uncharacterized protein LOC107823708 [Nicotiana tabacum]|uniref:Uncharacterized protein LOC107823708 n=1 Tax=Nicotiana tabacum TaxID=4097 RepID=A0A1S4CXK4_TOBAC|nr:uncharacterized protein LOC104117474 isoform X1 [Nicotiana tomentosiformis]XP_016505885.1 PREDICTED: uncharacterized protein LOC107823708 [Nicotiana tabacum]